jgi:cysteine-rich repeat protein
MRASAKLVLLLCWGPLGCAQSDAPSPPDAGPAVSVDADGDGVPRAEDCDDQDDQLGARTEDRDCDGYTRPEDCNDDNPSIYPGADEDWEDGVDQDCDGNADSICGDARIGNIETCDDGNEVDGDGCSHRCTIEAQCTEGCLSDDDCEGADERCIGQPGDLDSATGQCEQTNVNPEGLERPCSLENPCGPGLACLGAYTWDEDGWCVADWFAKDFYSHDLADLPEDGSRYSSSVIACGLASVPVDIVLYLHLDHPRPEDLLIELEDPNGQVGTVLDHEPWRPGPLVAQVGSGDDQVNGLWTLHVRDTVRGETGSLTGWSLYLLSRWD